MRHAFGIVFEILSPVAVETLFLRTKYTNLHNLIWPYSVPNEHFASVNWFTNSLDT